MDEYKALYAILRDMIQMKKDQTKFFFIVLIISLIVNLVEIGAFLYFESHMVTDTDTETITTTEQTVEGDDADIVNGDQYNDKSINQSGGGN